MRHKILDWGQAVHMIQTHQALGRRVVFTNGCFDLLHRGHLAYLEEAKALGDCLFIGVNSDASVVRLKGPKRPIMPQEDRLLMLAALEVVDGVVMFDEDTPIPLLEALRPDVHVKGGDYAPDSLPEYAVVTGYGGEVRVVSFVPNCSTSLIIDRIVARYASGMSHDH